MNDDGYDDDDVIRYPDIQIQIMINDWWPVRDSEVIQESDDTAS